MHYVYKYVYNNKIIYIGKTDNSIIKRLRQHGKTGDNINEKYWNEINNSKIYYCKLANKYMCDVVESELIRRYKPKCNKAKQKYWSGLEFVEPEWYYFDKELYKLKIDKSTIKQNNKTIYSKKQLEELENYKKLYNFYQAEYYEAKIKNEELEKEISELKLFKYYRNTRYKEIYNMMTNKCYVKDLSNKYLTYSQIIELYRNTNEKIQYESKAYNEDNELIVYKIIYTDEYDVLKYDFEQSYKKRKNGSIISSKGSLVASRESKTLYYSNTYKIMRTWDRVGNALYKKIENNKNKIER